MGSTQGTGSQGQWFRTTHWSVVLGAGSTDTSKRAKALEQLCRTYRYPLHAYIRGRGHSPHDTEDLTQAFFAQFLQRDGFSRVMPGRVKFRSWLLTCVKNFLNDEHARQHAQKRGGGQEVLSLDAEQAEQRYGIEPHYCETPEKLFERRWAEALLACVLSRLEEEFKARGKGGLLEQLRGFVFEGVGGRTYAEIAAEMSMTEEAVKKAAQRLRRRYQEILREEIGHTVSTNTEVEEELRYLWSVLGS
jgi:RNA polymerase sigma factor (sigma-70 family)